MRELDKLFIILLFLFSFSSLTYAASFSDNFANNLTFSVQNWSYVQGNIVVPHGAGGVLFKFNASDLHSQPQSMLVKGYLGDTPAGADNNLTTQLVNQVGNTLLLYIPNKTVSGEMWDHAVIFYNPHFINPNSLQGYGGDVFNLQYPTIKTTNTLSTFALPLGISTNASKSDLAFQFLTGVFNVKQYGISQSYVMLANRSLIGINFSIVVHPDNSHGINLTTAGSNVVLANHGSDQCNAAELATPLLGNYCYNYGSFPYVFPLGASEAAATCTAVPSNTAALVFNGLGATSGYDGVGFEAYFSTGLNGYTISPFLFTYGGTFVIADDGLFTTGTNTAGFIAAGHISGCGGTYGYLSNDYSALRNFSQVDFRIFSPNSITLKFIPAYTSNYIITNYSSNPNFINNTCTATIQNNQLWWCDYTQRQEIDNITWRYNFSTRAYANGNVVDIGNNHVIQFGTRNVPYLKLVEPKLNGMGYQCGNLFVASTNQSYGYIPFVLLNGNGGYCTLLLPNYTSTGHLNYNSLFLYYFSPTGLGNFGNANIGTYFIAKKAVTANVFTTSYNAPMLLSLTQALNPNSIIYINTAGSAYFAYVGGNQWETHIGTGGSQASTFSFTADTSFLVYTRYSGFCGINLLNAFSSSLGIQEQGNLFCNAYNATNSTVILSGNSGASSYGSPNYCSAGSANCINVSAYTPLKFNITRLATSYYSFGQVIGRTAGGMGLNISNTMLGNIKNKFPINTTATAVLVPFFPGVTLPRFIIGIIAIIALIMFAMLFNSEEVTGGAVGLIIVFLFGIFAGGLPVEILGLLLMSGFIIYEYNEGKKHGGH